MHAIHFVPNVKFCFQAALLLAWIAGLRQHDNAFNHASRRPTPKRIEHQSAMAETQVIRSRTELEKVATGK
jgi:hypothetical protein